jgi:cytochrome d ubiquinol oxidase subunit I
MAAELSRWQFATTSIYHFLFVPVTIGLAFLVALLQTAWYRSGVPEYRRLTRFFGTLLLINVAIGVVTGLVQEFEFGMNWATWARYVGDVFGGPLAMEGLFAFFLESTFIGLWIFGWNRLPRRVHLACIWCVAIGAMLSAMFIMIANSWMQHPVGYKINHSTGQAELTNVWALFTNGTFIWGYVHVILASLVTGSLVMLAVSAWHLRRQLPASAAGPPPPAPSSTPPPALSSSPPYASPSSPPPAPSSSPPPAPSSTPPQESSIPPPQPAPAARPPHDSPFYLTARLSLLVLVPAIILNLMIGSQLGVVETKYQPVKIAAAEAQWETCKPCSFSAFQIGGGNNDHTPSQIIEIPHLLSLLATGKWEGEVLGLNQLQQEYEHRYGPGNYIPNVFIQYWSMRVMAYLASLIALFALWGAWLLHRHRLERSKWFLRLAIWAVVTPFLMNTAGWMLTENGRQPWIVQGLMKTVEGASASVSKTQVIISLTVFVLIYIALGAADLMLMLRYGRKQLAESEDDTGAGGTDAAAGGVTGQEALPALTY